MLCVAGFHSVKNEIAQHLNSSHIPMSFARDAIYDRSITLKQDLDSAEQEAAARVRAYSIGIYLKQQG